jgi:hypothetical protein
MPVWAEVSLALLAFLGVSGTIAPFLAKRFHKGVEATQDERLKTIFTTHEELSGLRQSLEASMTACCAQANLAQEGAKLALKNADDALDGVNEVRIEQRRFNETLVQQVLKPLEGVMKEQQEVGRILAAQTAIMERIVKEWDRYRDSK